jgi:hypothetical protein
VFGRQRSPEKQHTRDVLHAENQVRLTEMKHRSAVKDAQRKVDKPLLTLERARDMLAPSLKVYWDRVETPSGPGRLTSDLSARVEGSGRSLVVIVENSVDGWGHTHDPHSDTRSKPTTSPASSTRWHAAYRSRSPISWLRPAPSSSA